MSHDQGVQRQVRTLVLMTLQCAYKLATLSCDTNTHCFWSLDTNISNCAASYHLPFWHLLICFCIIVYLLYIFYLSPSRFSSLSPFLPRLPSWYVLITMLGTGLWWLSPCQLHVTVLPRWCLANWAAAGGRCLQKQFTCWHVKTNLTCLYIIVYITV